MNPEHQPREVSSNWLENRGWARNEKESWSSSRFSPRRPARRTFRGAFYTLYDDYVRTGDNCWTADSKKATKL